MAVSFIGWGNHVWKKPWPFVGHWQTLSYKVLLSTHHLSGIRTHNVSGDRQVEIQLPYDHDPSSKLGKLGSTHSWNFKKGIQMK